MTNGVVIMVIKLVDCEGKVKEHPGYENLGGAVLYLDNFSKVKRVKDTTQKISQMVSSGNAKLSIRL